MKKIKFIIPTVAIAATTLATVATVGCSKTEKEESFVYDADVQKETTHIVDMAATRPGPWSEDEEEFNPYQLTFSGFKLQDKRESLGLKVKVKNQTFSEADLKTEIVMKEDGTSFDVLIAPDVLRRSEVINFDLEFSNAKSGVLFTSTGYSINFRNPCENDRFSNGEYTAYAYIDGQDTFFGDLKECGLCGTAKTRIRAMGDKDERSWDRKTFNYKLYFSPNFDNYLQKQYLNCLPENFLAYCESFNQDLQILLNSIVGVRIYDNFMLGCKSFNQPLTFTNSYFAYDGEPTCLHFMTNCDSMTSTIRFRGMGFNGFPSKDVIDETGGFLTTTNKDAPMNETGVPIYAVEGEVEPGLVEHLLDVFRNQIDEDPSAEIHHYRNIFKAPEPTK